MNPLAGPRGSKNVPGRTCRQNVNNNKQTRKRNKLCREFQKGGDLSSVFNACSYPYSSRTSNAQTDRTEDAYFYHRHCKHSERARSRIFGHNAPKPPLFIGWDALMAKFFQPMPGGFTNNFFFEFDKGVRTVRHRQTRLIAKLGE